MLVTWPDEMTSSKNDERFYNLEYKAAASSYLLVRNQLLASLGNQDGTFYHLLHQALFKRLRVDRIGGCWVEGRKEGRRKEGRKKGKMAEEKKDTATISREDVKAHNTLQDCWVIIHGVAYDVTKYLDGKLG